jgi:TRAP-type C4-dicarboxylate transport system permease large subunit
MIMVAAAAVINFIISIEGTTDTVAATILTTAGSPTSVLLIMIVFLLLLGLFLEPLSAMVITIPIIVPLMTGVGYDPIFIGVIMVFTLMIGIITPPFGLAVYLASDIADTSSVMVFREGVPYIITLIIALLIVALFPPIATYIPTQF